MYIMDICEIITIIQEITCILSAMLLDFSVQNFRSIRESQTLSLVATKEETFENTHTVETELTGNSRVLRSAVLYGANASGKTNFLKAMLFFQQFVGGSFSRSPEAPTG